MIRLYTTHICGPAIYAIHLSSIIYIKREQRAKARMKLKKDGKIAAIPHISKTGARQQKVRHDYCFPLVIHTFLYLFVVSINSIFH